MATAASTEFYHLYAQTVREMRDTQAAWVVQLRADGVKAARPDDGWVDRKRNSFSMQYPDFNDGPLVGDRVALGRPEQYRIVTISKIADEGIIAPQVRYHFGQSKEG